MEQITIDPLAISRRELRKLIPLSESHIRDMERERDPSAIPFIRVGRRVLYRLESVREWLRRHEIDPLAPGPRKQKSRRSNAGKSRA